MALIFPKHMPAEITLLRLISACIWPPLPLWGSNILEVIQERSWIYSVAQVKRMSQSNKVAEVMSCVSHRQKLVQ